MADEKVLPEGVRVFPKHPNAPDFVLASVVITMNDLFEFCKKNPQLISEYQGKKQIKLQLLKSREGKPYMVVDNYQRPSEQDASPSGGIIPNDTLPF